MAQVEDYTQALHMIARLGQPFSALLLLQQPNGEYKRVASENEIIVSGLGANITLKDIRMKLVCLSAPDCSLCFTLFSLSNMVCLLSQEGNEYEHLPAQCQISIDLLAHTDRRHCAEVARPSLQQSHQWAHRYCLGSDYLGQPDATGRRRSQLGLITPLASSCLEAAFAPSGSRKTFDGAQFIISADERNSKCVPSGALVV
ncbi:hypothetical protein EDD17DRAFT_299099 [Pisolithus thermaeus]|nr:hypothetical protein EDD17DRAFT_299099 [Pisolithus thermaeus]